MTRTTRPMRRRRSVRGVAGLAAFIAIASASVCASQVIEIDRDGSTRTFSGPTAFTSDGASSLPAVLKPHHRHDATARHRVSQGVAIADIGDEVSPQLVEAVAWQESRFRPGVVSRAGAIGEMQLMPATARALGIDPWNSAENYRGGARYLGQLMRRFDGDLVKSLAAYNAGPGAVERYRGVPPFQETRAYVAAVLDHLGRMAPPTPSNPATRTEGR